jgi:hypothetical protein
MPNNRRNTQPDGILEEVNQIMDLETNTREATLHKNDLEMTPSKDRVRSLKRHSLGFVPDDFDPDVLSWVLDSVAITDKEGGLEAKALGHYVINVAEEIRSNADAKIPVVPPEYGTDVLDTRESVDRVADIINTVVEDEQRKVVVHCYMGMERSVLCVVWYMHKYLGMSIDQAYGHISAIRPLAADRRDWVGL